MSVVSAKILPDSFNPAFFDALAPHFVQSWDWAKVRQQTGTKVLRVGIFEEGTLKRSALISLHPIPKVGKFFGLLSKCAPFTSNELQELIKIGKDHNVVGIRIEPDVEQGQWDVSFTSLRKSPRNYYIPYNYLVDLKQTEEALLEAMDQKTRYNIKVAQKHGVVIEQRSDTTIWETFITLQKETAQRQKFYLHSDDYYRTVFSTFVPQDSATFLIAKHPDGTILSMWFLMFFKKTITYLYGASSQLHREAMANNLMAWETIRLGKLRAMELFDFGGTLSENANPHDPRFGFHKFKKGFGGRHVSYVGSYDLVIDPLYYRIFTTADTIRWFLLRLNKR